MAKDKQFPGIPRPARRVWVQTNGDLAIIQDSHNAYWLVNRKMGRTYPDTFSLLEHTKREAASVVFLFDPSAPSPRWKVRWRR